MFQESTLALSVYLGIQKFGNKIKNLKKFTLQLEIQLINFTSSKKCPNYP